MAIELSDLVRDIRQFHEHYRHKPKNIFRRGEENEKRNPSRVPSSNSYM